MRQARVVVERPEDVDVPIAQRAGARLRVCSPASRSRWSCQAVRPHPTLTAYPGCVRACARCRSPSVSPRET